MSEIETLLLKLSFTVLQGHTHTGSHENAVLLILISLLEKLREEDT